MHNTRYRLNISSYIDSISFLLLYLWNLYRLNNVVVILFLFFDENVVVILFWRTYNFILLCLVNCIGKARAAPEDSDCDYLGPITVVLLLMY